MKKIESQSILSFIKELPNDESCKAYLSKVKWQDGFVCNKCKHAKGFIEAGYTYVHKTVERMIRETTWYQ